MVPAPSATALGSMSRQSSYKGLASKISDPPTAKGLPSTHKGPRRAHTLHGPGLGSESHKESRFQLNHSQSLKKIQSKDDDAESESKKAKPLHDFDDVHVTLADSSPPQNAPTILSSDP